jgi:hypothetical protein
MGECIICGKQTKNDTYRFCQACFKQLRDQGVLVECKDCGEWYYVNTHCLCKVFFVQCKDCGRWHYKKDKCICELSVDKTDGKIYQKKTNLLSPAEQKFKAKLEQAIDLHKYDINCQTSLRQLVEKKEKWRWANELNRDIDFCIVRKSDYEIVLCIEYDDSTHEQPERIERDIKVEKIFREVGLILVRIKRDDKISIDYLRGKLENYLK